METEEVESNKNIGRSPGIRGHMISPAVAKKQPCFKRKILNHRDADESKNVC